MTVGSSVVVDGTGGVAPEPVRVAQAAFVLLLVAHGLSSRGRSCPALPTAGAIGHGSGAQGDERPSHGRSGAATFLTFHFLVNEYDVKSAVAEQSVSG